MPVEFRCPMCQALLRTQDSAIGRDARCPACAALVPVPRPPDMPTTSAALTTASTPLGLLAVAPLPIPAGGTWPTAVPVKPPPTMIPTVAATEPAPDLNATLPYTPRMDFDVPIDGSGSGPASKAELGIATPTIPAGRSPDVTDSRQPQREFRVGEILVAATESFLGRAWASLGIGLLALVVWTLLQSLIVGAAAGLLALAGAADDPPLQGLAQLLALGTAGLAIVASLALAAWLWSGLRWYALRVARGEPARVRDLFAGGPVLPMMVLLAVIGILWLVGTALAVIPGILVASLLGQSISYRVDRRAPAWESLRWSLQWSLPQWWRMTSLYALLCLLYLTCSAVSGGFALIVVVPFAEIAVATGYLRILQQRQPT